MQTATAPEGRPMLGRLLRAATDAEAAAAEALWPLSDEELSLVVQVVARLGNAVDRCAVKVVDEADGRGVGSSRGLTTVDWVVSASHGRVTAQRAAQLLRVAQAAEATGMEGFCGAFLSGALSLEKADRIGSFERLVRPVANRDDVLADVEILVAGASHQMRDGQVCADAPVPLTPKELGVAIRVAGQHLRPAPELETEERAARAGRALFKSQGPAMMSTYRLVLDPEGSAVVDAAVAAYSHPVPGANGERDPRSAATRRADALLTVIEKGVAASSDTPRGEKAQVVVTIDYELLVDRVRGAGLTDTGQVLSPATARRMACDAGLIPIVLGGDGAVLDVGRGDRFFRGAIRRSIAYRDKGCTWPGCTVPAGSCEGHHNTWWSRGGTTCVADGCLLCRRHHTLVHELEIRATITATRVIWPTGPP